jgi:hypothetical protein
VMMRGDGVAATTGDGAAGVPTRWPVSGLIAPAVDVGKFGAIFTRGAGVAAITGAGAATGTGAGTGTGAAAGRGVRPATGVSRGLGTLAVGEIAVDPATCVGWKPQS